MIRIIFAPDEDENRIVNDVAAPIAIVDDLINEAIEQVFVVQLQLISSVNPGSIDLTVRQASLCRIIDDDSKCCLLYTSPSPRDATLSRMPSSA